MLKNSLLNVQKKGAYFSALASKLVNSKFNQTTRHTADLHFYICPRTFLMAVLLSAEQQGSYCFGFFFPLKLDTVMC